MSGLISVETLRRKLHNYAIYIQAAVLLLAALTPLFISTDAQAAQLLNRKVTISTSKADATSVAYNFEFNVPTATPIQGIVFDFCTTPNGTCTKPTGMNISHPTVSSALAGTWTASTAFAEYTGADSGACTDHDGAAASTQYCVNRTSATNESGTRQYNVTGVTNPSIAGGTSNTPVYVRIALYNNSTFTGTAVHDGVVAASINQQLTVTGRVLERLIFCVAAISDVSTSDTNELPDNVAACASENNTVVDLGVIDNTTTAKSPVPSNPPTTQGNNRYGIAMVNTNSAGGIAVTYFAEPDAGGTNQTTAFRVPGAACNASAATLTDQCFQSAGAGGTTITTGTEGFGLSIPCIMANNGSTVDNLSSTTMNLSAAAAYNSEGTTTPAANCEVSDAGTKYAWNTTGTATTLASSSAPVDNEIVKMRFAATASTTTPAGAYTVTSTYIATPTF